MSCTKGQSGGAAVPLWDFSFLTDADTVRYIATQIQVLFLTYRIPYKERSSLVQTIAECYKDSSTVCSTPSPNWKHQMKESFEKQIQVVIANDMDSTVPEVRDYFSLAHEYDYTTIVVPSREQSINQEALSSQIVYPFFYGWHLGRRISLETQGVGKKIFRECIQQRKFVEIFKKQAISGSPRNASGDLDLDHYFSLDGLITGTTLLHCTSFYSNYGEVAGSREYATDPMIRQNTGRAYSLNIIGFIITPRTFGVRLRLSPAELHLWPANDSGVKVPEEEAKTDRKTEKLTTDGVKKGEIPCPDNWHPTQFSPTCGSGSQAHLTLGVGKGTEAYQTGYDLNAIIQKELEAVEHKDSILTLPLESGTLHYYRDGEWALYLNNSLEVKALFSGWY